jgi:hypothetical protein
MSQKGYNNTTAAQQFRGGSAIFSDLRVARADSREFALACMSEQRFGEFLAANETQLMIVERVAALAVATIRAAEDFAIGIASRIHAKFHSVL